MVTDNAKLERERQFHDRRFAEDTERQQKVGKFLSDNQIDFASQGKNAV